MYKTNLILIRFKQLESTWHPGMRQVENHPYRWFWDLDRPESGILLALVIITGEKNRETQSHTGAGAARRAAAGTGRRQTPAGAIHTGRQNTCGYGGPLRATGIMGTGEGRPLRATDKEEGKREGRPCINIIMRCIIQCRTAADVRAATNDTESQLLLLTRSVT
jgi:hypothetical protein